MYTNTKVKPEIARKMRINKLLDEIRKQKIMEYNRAIGYCGLNWGTAKRTAVEYITLLIDTGMIRNYMIGDVSYLELTDDAKKESNKELLSEESYIDTLLNSK